MVGERSRRHAVLTSWALAGAAEPSDAPAPAAGQERKAWEVEAAIPFWVPGSHGTLTVRDRTSRLSVTPGDLIDDMNSGNAFGGAGYFKFRYDRFRGPYASVGFAC